MTRPTGGTRRDAKPGRRAAPRASRARPAPARRARPAGGDGPLQGSTHGVLLVSAGLLAGLGVVMSYSTTALLELGGPPLPPHFSRHLVGLGAALLCVAVTLRIPLAVWRALALPLWGASVVLLALTLMAGVRVNAATRWLEIPGLGLRFQPAELARFATVLAVAAVLAQRRDRTPVSPRRMGLAVAIAIPPAALLLRQPDFGSCALLLALVGLLLFAAGVPLRRLVLPAVATAATSAVFVAFHAYALRRFLGFLDPWQRSQNEGFQLVQSFVAFGRGGITGVGLGDGRQKLGFLPEAHTDFILSVVAEELGLLGVWLVLAAFAVLWVAGTKVAQRAREPFALLLAFGMTAFLSVPAAVNSAVVMGLLPTTGFTLPLISYGRTSLLTCALALGILLRAATREAPPRTARVAGAAPRGLVRS